MNNNEISIQETFEGKLYLTFALLSLVLFYYAHADFLPDKFFYVPCAGALISGLFFRFHNDWVDYCLLFFVFFSFMSDLLNQTFPHSLISAFLRQTLGILCFSKLRHFDSKVLIKYFSRISPVIVVSYYVFSNPLGGYVYDRYGGFSGDPNYLAISLTLLIAMNLLYIHQAETTKIWKAISVVSIIGTIPLFLVGQSRAGIIALCVMLMFYFVYLYKYHKGLSIVLCGIVLLMSGSVYYHFQKTFNAVNQRFNDISEGGGRTVQIYGVADVYSKHPLYVITGIGIDNSPLQFEEFRIKSNYIIHDTYLDVLFGQGIVTLIIFLWLLYKTFRKTLLVDKWQIYIGLYLSLLDRKSVV